MVRSLWITGSWRAVPGEVMLMTEQLNAESDPLAACVTMRILLPNERTAPTSPTAVPRRDITKSPTCAHFQPQMNDNKE